MMGAFASSNNAAERELRAVALGRKNWTFAGSDDGGRRAAAIYTLIATAKLNGVDPQALARRRAGPLARSLRQTHSRTPALELAPAKRRRRRCLTIIGRPIQNRSALWPSPDAYAEATFTKLSTSGLRHGVMPLPARDLP